MDGSCPAPQQSCHHLKHLLQETPGCSWAHSSPSWFWWSWCEQLSQAVRPEPEHVELALSDKGIQALRSLPPFCPRPAFLPVVQLTLQEGFSKCGICSHWSRGRRDWEHPRSWVPRAHAVNHPCTSCVPAAAAPRQRCTRVCTDTGGSASPAKPLGTGGPHTASFPSCHVGSPEHHPSLLPGSTVIPQQGHPRCHIEPVVPAAAGDHRDPWSPIPTWPSTDRHCGTGTPKSAW